MLVKKRNIISKYSGYYRDGKETHFRQTNSAINQLSYKMIGSNL